MKPKNVVKGVEGITTEVVHQSSRVVQVGSELHKETNSEPYRPQPKQGRNAWCACGSGKKYKNCCGGIK